MVKTSITIVSIIAVTIILMNFTVMISENNTTYTDYDRKHTELLVRTVGHQVLLHAGDSTSRVLPVNKIGENSYELQFENEFAFKPDTLVSIVRKSLVKEGSPLNFVVNVMECQTQEMVYGFEIQSTYSDIEPCLGRTQPRGCYAIQITFFNTNEESAFSSFQYVSLFALLGLGCLALVINPILKSRGITTKKIAPKTISRFIFNEEQGRLELDDQKISLTSKEAKILKILLDNANRLVDRQYLVKEIWENEGVITGRSLDVFISKLRKKLSLDPSVKITNVHGRGYKLETS